MTAPIAPPDAPPEGDAPRPAAAPVQHTRRAGRRIRRRTATGAAPVDRANRVILFLLGTVAVGVGLVVLLAGPDALDLPSPAALHADAVSSARRHDAWWTAGAVGGGGLICVLGLCWAWTQIRRRPERGRLGPTRLATIGTGRTTLEPAPVAGALAADVGRLDGVTSASARLVTLRPAPEVVLTVDVGLDCDLQVLEADLEGPFGRLAQALDAQAVHAEVRIGVTRRSTSPRVT